MKYIQSAYNGTHDELILCPIGDIHIGSPSFDAKVLKRHLDFIREHRDQCRIILMGDLLETATKDSVGAGWAEATRESGNKEEERRALLNEHLIKAKGYLWEFRDLVDCIIDGNHELRVYKQSGLKLMDTFAEMMGIREKYCAYQGVVEYQLNQRAYHVNAWHGAGGGRKTGSSVNRVGAQREYVIADIYLMGHTHRTHVHKETAFMPDPQHKRMQAVTQYFIGTGHTLTYEESYAEAAGLPPSDTGFPICYLYGKRDGNVRTKKVRVVVE